METTLLILFPIGAALALWIIPWASTKAAAGFALLVALAELALWVGIALNFDFAFQGNTIAFVLGRGHGAQQHEPEEWRQWSPHRRALSNDGAARGASGVRARSRRIAGGVSCGSAAQSGSRCDRQGTAQGVHPVGYRR